jgi:hypothetical protein
LVRWRETYKSDAFCRLGVEGLNDDGVQRHCKTLDDGPTNYAQVDMAARRRGAVFTRKFPMFLATGSTLIWMTHREVPGSLWLLICTGYLVQIQNVYICGGGGAVYSWPSATGDFTVAETTMKLYSRLYREMTQMQ